MAVRIRRGDRRARHVATAIPREDRRRAGRYARLRHDVEADRRRVGHRRETRRRRRRRAGPSRVIFRDYRSRRTAEPALTTTYDDA